MSPTNPAPRPAPPRIPLRALERWLDERVRDSIVGDLVETYAASPNPLRFWREAVSALWHFHASLQLPEVRMSSFVTDLRQGARVLRRAPAFSVICIATLALAIGPTTAILSLVDALLVQPLPYASPDRLAFVWDRGKSGEPVNVGYATYDDIRHRATTLASISASSFIEMTLASPTDPERLEGAGVTANYFATLGVPMYAGRDFTADDDQPGHTNVVILTHGLWTRRFGGSRDIVGHTIDLDGAPSTVIGVLPASFDDVIRPRSAIYRPLGYVTTQAWACRSCRHLTAVARIRDGVSDEQALAELNQISTQMAREFPKDYAAAGVVLSPMRQWVTRDLRPALLAILGAVALVLLIAVANVVNLQLARAVRREGEFAVRVALGAGTMRLAQQLVAEGLLIAAAGAAAGVALGRAVLPALVARLPNGTPRAAAIHLDVDVLAAIAVVIALLAIVLGVIPALGARRRALFDGTLRGAARVSGTAHHRARGGLVVGEIALALLLLAGAGLLGRSLDRLLAVNPGFDPHDVITMQLEASGPRYTKTADVVAFRERQIAAARAVPGVIDVGLGTSIPLAGIIDRYSLVPQDRPLTNPALAPLGDGFRVFGDFRRALRIPLIAGRAFDAADMRDSSASVVIVSQALAAKLWPGENALGKRVFVPNTRAPFSTVVGIAGNVRHTSLDAPDGGSQFYIPETAWQWISSQTELVARVRNGSDAGAVLRRVRDAVAAVDPSQPITEVRANERRSDLVDSAAKSGAAAVRGVRGAGAAARRGRHLWSALRQRRRAHARDRVAKRARRDAGGSAAAGAWSRTRAHVCRTGAGDDRRVGADAISALAAVRHRAHGSDDVRRGGAFAEHGRWRGVSRAGATGDTDRSDDSFERIVERSQRRRSGGLNDESGIRILRIEARIERIDRSGDRGGARKGVLTTDLTEEVHGIDGSNLWG